MNYTVKDISQMFDEITEVNYIAGHTASQTTSFGLTIYPDYDCQWSTVEDGIPALWRCEDPIIWDQLASSTPPCTEKC